MGKDPLSFRTRPLPSFHGGSAWKLGFWGH